MELWVFKVRRSGVIASEMKEEWGDVLCYWTISKKKREGGSGGVGSAELGSAELGSGRSGGLGSGGLGSGGSGGLGRGGLGRGGSGE